MTLSEYEEREWTKLVKRKNASLNQRVRRVLPEAVRERGRRAAAAGAEKAKKVPGSEKVSEAYAAAAGGAGKALTRTVNTTLSSERVVRAYAKRGHEIDELDGLAAIDLKIVDKVAHFTRMRHRYAGAAMAEGGVAGLMMAGGMAGAAAGGVFGLGAGAAPGLGAIAATMVGDTAAVLGLAGRVVAHTAMYYGFDPTSPEEELFLISVIGLGMASGHGAKVTAFADLHQLTGLLARRATWSQLNDKVFSKIMQRFAAKFGERLTQRKLGQFVPIAGIAVGATLNYKIIDDIADAAELAYRERWLRAKGAGGGTDAPEPTWDATSDGVDGEVVEEIEVRPLDIAREELGEDLS